MSKFAAFCPPELPDYVNYPSATEIGPYDYTRCGNPTLNVLESLLAKLDKADRAFCFTSGMAALAAVSHLVGTGQEIAAGDDLYGGSDRLLSQVTLKTGIVVKRVNPCKLDEIASAIGPCTKLVWVESPTNPRQQICDIRRKASRKPLVISGTLGQAFTTKEPSATVIDPCDYTRSGNPTRDVLESLLAKLDKADRAFCCTSGMAALAAVTHLFGTGQEIAAGDDLYGGSDRLLSQVTLKTGIVVKRVNPCKLDEIASAIGPCTKLVWVESPTNPRQQICDIRIGEAIMGPGFPMATVGGTVHGWVRSGDGGTVEFHTINGTGSGQGGASSRADSVEFHTIHDGTGVNSGAGGTVEFHTINDGTGGANSGAGGTVEFQTIHVEEEQGDSESAPSISQEALSPTSSYDTSIATHQSDQQPPPGIPPPGTQIEDGTVQEERRSNITLLATTFIMVSTTNAGTIVTSRLSAVNSLSENDKILLASSMACSTAGFLLCVGGYILGPRRRAKLAALLTGIGGIFTIVGFILMMSTIF